MIVLKSRPNEARREKLYIPQILHNSRQLLYLQFPLILIIKFIIFFKSILVTKPEHYKFTSIHHKNSRYIDLNPSILEIAAVVDDAKVEEALECYVFPQRFSWEEEAHEVDNEDLYPEEVGLDAEDRVLDVEGEDGGEVESEVAGFYFVEEEGEGEAEGDPEDEAQLVDGEKDVGREEVLNSEVEHIC